MFIMRLAIILIVLVLYIFSSLPLLAKGLDELSPEVNKSQDQQGEQGEKPAVKELLPEEKDAEIDKRGPADSEVKKGDEEQKDSLKQSDFSKELSNKLYLAGSFGIVSVSKNKGTWRSSNGTPDVSLGYRVLDEVIPKTSLYATFRYLPINVTVTDKRQSYEGIVELYRFGATAKYKLAANFSAFAMSEIGIINTSLQSADEFKEDETLESGSWDLTLGGGSEWTISEKLLIGPRLSIGLGSIQIVQLSVNLSFMF